MVVVVAAAVVLMVGCVNDIFWAGISQKKQPPFRRDTQMDTQTGNMGYGK